MCSFTCFRWMFSLTPSTLKLLNQVRPGTGEKQGGSVLRTHVKVNRKVSKPATLIKKMGESLNLPANVPVVSMLLYLWANLQLLKVRALLKNFRRFIIVICQENKSSIVSIWSCCNQL